ncbi:MAG: LytTR family DNA-binding domain-containing protein [Lachnospiraceae bacterium]|nr:LytTR family DNA-binding domain-containing protein [Lachnospiraceae bacterium]
MGQKLRQDILNEVTQIVYMSSEQGYAMSLFQNRPMDFLLKPVDQDTVDRVMQEYRRVYDRQNHFFEFQIGRAEHRISFGTILYFQCEGKKIHIVTCDGQRRQFYGSMKKVEEQLDRNVFCVIHKSYIVNAAYVSEFRIYEVIMVTGEALPISQPMRKKVQKWLLEVYMIKRRL